MRLILRFVRDDGNSFILGGSYLDEASWGITKLEGVGMLQGEFTTESYADMDGSEITGERIPQRAVDVTAMMREITRLNAGKYCPFSIRNVPTRCTSIGMGTSAGSCAR